jgi:hypothetical protein
MLIKVATSRALTANTPTLLIDRDVILVAQRFGFGQADG